MTLDELIAHLQSLRDGGLPGTTSMVLTHNLGYVSDIETEYRDIGEQDITAEQMKPDDNSSEWNFAAGKFKAETILLFGGG